MNTYNFKNKETKKTLFLRLQFKTAKAKIYGDLRAIEAQIKLVNLSTVLNKYRLSVDEDNFKSAYEILKELQKKKRKLLKQK